ncbi:MAG: sugar phosphate isomerase/epimerase family protein [Thermoguttaceae bacterium]
MDRRSFLGKGIGAAALSLAGVSAAQAQQRVGRNRVVGKSKPKTEATEKKADGKIPVALGLYSIREACAKDLAGSLKKVAEMGYDGVEFAGYYGHDPKEIRKMLDTNGLKCSGTHTGLQQLLGENFDKTVETHKILGTKFVIVPGGIDAALHTVAGNEMTAYLFNEIAEKLEKHGMHLGYHAHGGDFAVIDGQTAWDRFFANTRNNVFMQMDVGNCIGGGGDPYEPISKFPGRSKTIHLKEHSSNNAPVGKGDVDWNKVFELCESVGGTEWYVVEHETSPAEFDGVEECIKNVREMGK